MADTFRPPKGWKREHGGWYKRVFACNVTLYVHPHTGVAELYDADGVWCWDNRESTTHLPGPRGRMFQQALAWAKSVLFAKFGDDQSSTVVGRQEGDYIVFRDEAALWVSETLALTLTQQGEEDLMTGYPASRAEHYAALLAEAGIIVEVES